jgi:hypothetical protein
LVLAALDGNYLLSLRGRLAELRQRVIGHEVAVLRQENDEHMRQVRLGLGKLMSQTVARSATDCRDAEFSAYSQYGEDGIIEYLIQRADITPEVFVEIGVETYIEANTRFLAEHRQWRGLIVDQNPELHNDLARTRLNWRSQVTAVSSFVTRENIKPIVASAVGSDGLGLLSVDIDGVDYWILERLVDFQPALVIVEYNALFGPTAPVTVPYDPVFDRRRSQFHNIYYGAGLAAFDRLLTPRGYSLVACNTAGNNAFFVQSDRLGDVPARGLTEVYRPRRFVEHRAADGTLTGMGDPRRQVEDIRDLPLVDLTDGSTRTVADCLGL